jgi:hypothetical protein
MAAVAGVVTLGAIALSQIGGAWSSTSDRQAACIVAGFDGCGGGDPVYHLGMATAPVLSAPNPDVIGDPIVQQPGSIVADPIHVDGKGIVADPIHVGGPGIVADPIVDVGGGVLINTGPVDLGGVLLGSSGQRDGKTSNQGGEGSAVNAIVKRYGLTPDERNQLHKTIHELDGYPRPSYGDIEAEAQAIVDARGDK